MLRVTKKCTLGLGLGLINLNLKKTKFVNLQINPFYPDPSELLVYSPVRKNVMFLALTATLFPRYFVYMIQINPV